MTAECAAELYGHAIAMEREAAQRYAEFAGTMAQQGNYAVAALFKLLSTREALHLDELRRRSAPLALPPLDADHSWPGGMPPKTQRQALAIALQAEKAARAFFDHAARVAPDAPTRTLAEEMAAEEAHHAVLIERMLLP